MARASEWLPLVVRLRTEEGRTWEDVVRAVNAQAAGQGGRSEGQPMTWTKARLVRAVRALVRDGLAPATVIAARGHQRTAVTQDRQAVVRAVAAVVGQIGEDGGVAAARAFAHDGHSLDVDAYRFGMLIEPPQTRVIVLH